MERSLAEREALFRSRPGEFWTLDRIAAALGELALYAPVGTQSFPGVSTDTRTIRPGEVFIALVGERFDAHRFLDVAVSNGAAALVVSQAGAAAGLGLPTFVVTDTLLALGAMARYYRRAWGSGRLVAGITGTNGKTSTRELTAAALGARLQVAATSGNLNNRVGVPLTLLSLGEGTDAAVIEMGTSLPGEIATLRDLVEPDIAVVTSVAEGHLEGLGSVAGVLAEKCSIFAGAAVAIVPASQPEIAEGARAMGVAVRSAGLGSGDLAATSWGVAEDGSWWLEVRGERVRVPLKGIHNLRNAMLALAVAEEGGVSLREAASALSSLQPQRMRLETVVLRRKEDGARTSAGGSVESVLINDAYNANPGSMAAAIEYLASFPITSQRVLILGEMLELGTHAAELHDRVAQLALSHGFDLIGATGEFARSFKRVAPASDQVVVADDAVALWEAIQPRLRHPAAILIKASRSVRMEQIVPRITAWAAD